MIVHVLDDWFVDRVEKLYPNGMAVIRQIPTAHRHPGQQFRLEVKIGDAPWVARTASSLENALVLADALIELER